MTETSIAQKKRERYRLEGALGYALRIAKRIQDKTANSSEEISKMIEEDHKHISSALSFHYKDDLTNAGFAVGLFNDELTAKSETQK